MVTDTFSDSASVSPSGQALDVTESLAASGGAIGPSWLDQDGILRTMWTENKSPEEISEALGRSIAAIMTRAARLGLPRRAAPGRKRGYKRSEAPRKVAPAGSSRVRVVLPAPPEEEVVYAQPEVKVRICLMCLNKFQSQGRHNRICPSCKGSAEYATGSCTPDFTFKVVT